MAWRDCVAGAALAVVVAGCEGRKAPAVALGQPAPSYQAVAINGDPVSLSDLRGRVVLLNIWATWCAPCREEIPYLQQLEEHYRNAGLEVVGVSIDARGEEDDISDFAGELGMTYPIWLDPDQRVSTRFLSLGVPSTYLIDRDGILRWRHLGVLRASNVEFQEALAAALETSPAR